jgi:tetratricopeptide (TPR) repeat protein
MANVDEKINALIDELDSDEHARIKQRADTSPAARENIVGQPLSDDEVTRALRRVEESVNSVRLSRGEEPVEIVTAAEFDEDLRTQLKQAIAGGTLSDVAEAATVGVYLRKIGRSQQARAALQNAAERGDVMAATTLALALEEQGESESALQWQLFAAEKGDDLAQYNLGRMLHERGQTEAATEWLSKSNDPRAAELLRTITDSG